MNKTLPVAMGGIILVLFLAWSSFAAAAPAAKSTPVPHQTATATPVPTTADDGEADPSGSAPDADVEAAGVTPTPPGPMTSRIFIFNLDTANTATVRIDFYKSDGTSAGAILPFTIPPNGAIAKPLPSGISSGFMGSAVVSSDKNVQAFVTDSNSGNAARDEYDGTLLPNANLILPFVRHLAPNTQNSIIAVQNTGNASADITLQLYKADGSLGPSKKQTSVAPLASAYFDTGNIISSGTFTGTAEISASGSIALAGSEQTRFLKDTASFRALTLADEGGTLYVGFVERRRNSAGTPTSWSEIYVRNDGSSATDITAQFYSAAGALMSAVTTTRLQVPVNGMAQFLTNAPEFSSLTSSGAYFKGWATITSSGQPLALYSLEAQNSGKRLFGMSGTASTGVGAKFACGDTFRYASPSQYSTINIVNPTGTSASVTVKLYKASTGAAAGTKTVSVGANKLVSVVLSDGAFTNAGSSFEGLAVVTATGSQVFASVYTPYGSGGITSYTCTRLP